MRCINKKRTRLFIDVHVTDEGAGLTLASPDALEAAESCVEPDSVAEPNKNRLKIVIESFMNR